MDKRKKGRGIGEGNARVMNFDVEVPDVFEYSDILKVTSFSLATSTREIDRGGASHFHATKYGR
jgi:hypothetical protein